MAKRVKVINKTMYELFPLDGSEKFYTDSPIIISEITGMLESTVRNVLSSKSGNDGYIPIGSKWLVRRREIILLDRRKG